MQKVFTFIIFLFTAFKHYPDTKQLKSSFIVKYGLKIFRWKVISFILVVACKANQNIFDARPETF